MLTEEDLRRSVVAEGIVMVWLIGELQVSCGMSIVVRSKSREFDRDFSIGPGAVMRACSLLQSKRVKRMGNRD